MADNKNIDESAEALKEKTESLRKEIHDFANFQKFTLREFKRSESFKKLEKYTSLGSLIPENNRSIGADVARLLLGGFKEKKPLVELRDKATGELIRDENGKVKKVDPSDNSFKARLKRSGLTSFGRYISDDKQGIGYDILRTFAGRFGDDFIGKKKTLSSYEKQISELSSQEQNRENASTEASDCGEILTKIYENTEGIATALNVSNRKTTESTEELIDISKKNVDVNSRSLDAQTKTSATALEKELETKKTLEDVSVALKDIQKGVRNTVNLATKSVGGASGGGEGGGVLDDIADVASILLFGKGILGKVGGAFGSIFGKIKGFGASTAGMLKHGAKVGTDKALPLLHTAKDSVKSVGAKVTSKVAPKIDSVKDSAKKVLDKGKAVGTNALEKGKAIGTNVLDKGKDALVSGRSAINNIPTPKIFDFAKKGGLIGAGITAVSSIFDINKASDEIDEKVKLGIISKEDANRAKTNNAIEIGSKGAGGAVGGLVGASKGAALGATLGSVVPVLGTGVGAVLGGLIGGFGGEKIGSWLGSLIGDSVTDDVKENSSFEERFKELDERRKTFYNTTENRRAIRKELFDKKMSEREKLVPIEKLLETSFATGESMESLLEKERSIVWREANSEVDTVLNNRRAEWDKDRAILVDEIREADPELYASIQKKDAKRRENAKRFSGDGSMLIGAYGVDPVVDPQVSDKTQPKTENTPPKKDTGKNSTQKTESKKEGAKENKPKIEPKKDDVVDVVGFEGNKPKKDDVKGNKSFEEQLKDLEVERRKIADIDYYGSAKKLREKRLSELDKPETIERLQKTSAETGESVESLLAKERFRAGNESRARSDVERYRQSLFDKNEATKKALMEEIRVADPKLYDSLIKKEKEKRDKTKHLDGGLLIAVEGGTTPLKPNNISPSNKNQESEKMVNESERANFNEKQRQAESGKTSENVINNVHQTNVNNNTVQNRQLKPRSEHSIADRANPNPFFF